MTDKPEVLSACAVRAEIQKEAVTSNDLTDAERRQARAFIDNWLWLAPGRRTRGEGWNNLQMSDLVSMVAEYAKAKASSHETRAYRAKDCICEHEYDLTVPGRHHNRACPLRHQSPQKATAPPGDCNRCSAAGDSCDRNCNWPECGCVCDADGVMRNAVNGSTNEGKS